MKNLNENNYSFTMPHEVMRHFEIGRSNKLNVDINDETIVITKEEKTATEILKSITKLNEVSAGLMFVLAKACGECSDLNTCNGCDDLDDCDFEEVPEMVFDAFLDNGVCIGRLYDLINSDEPIKEVVDEE